MMSSASPIHVHVQDNTPVHVHVKKPKGSRSETRFTHEPQGLKKTPKPTAKSQKVPWIPAPGKTSLRDKNKQGYMWDFGLRREMEPELDVEDLRASRASLKEQQRELEELEKEFDEAERENTRLQRSFEQIKDDFVESGVAGEVGSGRDALMKKLVEVEMDGAACEKELSTLKDIANKLKGEEIISGSDLGILKRQRELLTQKIKNFAASNRGLVRLLKEQRDAVAEVKRQEELQHAMIQKMAASDSASLKLKSEVTFLKNELEQVIEQLHAEKNHSRTLGELNKSVDATRAHLQRELRAKEMENNRLQVQMRNIELDSVAAVKEAEEVKASATLAKETFSSEKEALKKATRAQRQRAERADQLKLEMEGKFAEKEVQHANAVEETETWKTRYHRAMDDRARAENRCKSMSDKVDEMEANLRRNESKAREREQDLMERVHKLTSENTTNELECSRLKEEIRTLEQKMKMVQEDVSSQRAQAQQYETLNSELRASLAKTKNEAEEALIGAERAEREARRLAEQGADEIDTVRRQMIQRMKDLQPLPDLLKETEMKLQDAQDQLHVYEKRCAEQTKVISELTSREELHSDDVDDLKRKILVVNDENRALQARLDIMHTKLDDNDAILRSSAVEKADKDESIQSLQIKLEEKTHLCNSLQRQLDAALQEVRKTAELERNKSAAREKASQARITDLETQITRSKTDAAGLKRSKLDSERRLQSQLQDARDRLEQSESTNRSMRNYVNFLKSSYNTVFGADASLTSSPVRADAGASRFSPPGTSY